MAVLRNVTGSLRLELFLADIELPVKGQQPVFRRVLSRAAVESFEKADGEWWPLVRLASLWFALDEARELVESLERTVRGEQEGFSWSSKAGGELGLQIGTAAEGHSVEVGIDLHRLLSQQAGVEERPGANLALFRFEVARAELVAFASGLKQELGELVARG